MIYVFDVLDVLYSFARATTREGLEGNKLTGLLVAKQSYYRMDLVQGSSAAYQ